MTQTLLQISSAIVLGKESAFWGTLSKCGVRITVFVPLLAGRMYENNDDVDELVSRA